MLDRADAWRHVRLTHQRAGWLLADFIDRGHATSLPVARLAQREVRRQLAGWPAERMNGADLVVSCTEFFALSDGRDSFLPDAVRPIRASERWALYLHWLWTEAERDAVGQPQALVSTAVVRAALGQVALDEVPARIKRHLGTDAAIWVLLARWPYDGSPVTDDEVRQATAGFDGRLVRAVRKSVRASLRASADDVQSQVAATLLTEKEYAEVHPVDLLARAFDGGINIAPRRIGNDTSRELLKGLPTPARPSRPRARSIVVEFRPGEELPEPAAVGEPDDPEGLAIAAEGSRRDRRRLARALSVDPAAFAAMASTAGEKVHAARTLGTSRPTLDKRLAKMATGMK